jgi:hypothetical protein
MSKFLVLCANASHPSKELKFFLLEDEDGETLEFESLYEARTWCLNNPSEFVVYHTCIEINMFL